MAKTRFKSFSVKKQGFQGLNCKKIRDLNIITYINPRFIT
jgi:hypothetical protein